MKGKLKFSSVLFILFFLHTVQLHAQPNTGIELKDKPKKYENRKLRSEKTGEKKLSIIGRGFQNLYTHYNYWFNANNKLNEIIAVARATQKDDYNKLLPYYNYSTDITAAQNNDIDSIIYKITSGILLHDLRNDWIDDMYMLLGKAYYHRKDFDSAAYTFQYINYAYAPKQDGGYDLPIGSNASETNGVFTIATAEKKQLFKKPAARNEALIWLSRSFIENNRNAEAMGILEILRRDPNFPKRLQAEWNETAGFLQYKQKNYDSAAYFLSQSLDLAVDNTDKGRKAYLTAQLFELSGNHAKAVEWFNRSAKFTNDPVMEVYAALYAIRSNNASDAGLVQQKRNDLLKMAKRDKYESYRSIIYYIAAQLELEQRNYAAADAMLQQSIKYSIDPSQKNAAFLLLGDMSFNKRAYGAASNFYDSLQIAAVTNADDLERITGRKPPLTTVRTNLELIKLQDSLQMLASLSEDERNTILKRAAKQQKNQQGYQLTSVNNNSAFANDKPTELFSTGSSGNWYFNNTSLRSTGFREFKTRWGNRPNTDNWRRAAAIQNTGIVNDPTSFGGDVLKPNQKNTAADAQNNLPLTPEAINASNKLITDALLSNAKTFQYEFKDLLSAAEAYNRLLSRYPKADNREEALYNYFQLLNADKQSLRADSVKTVLRREYPNGMFIQVADNPGYAAMKENAAAKVYTNVYDLFIEGRFNEALKEKQKADSLFGNRFWTPQLMFIESIYYVQERNDSVAIARLTQLQNNFKTSPLAERAKTMADVLKRRAEIESYLTNLQIERKQDEVLKPVDLNTTVITEKPKADLTVKAPLDKKIEIKKDTIAANPVIVSKRFVFAPNAPHYVVLMLDKVAPAFVNEVKNAFNRYNQQNFYNQRISLSNIVFDERFTFVLLAGFNTAGEAVAYAEKTKPVTSSRIVPWLTGDKLRFTVIDAQNLQLLLENKDLEGYKKLIEQVLPGKF